jgi:cytochrome c553
MQMGKRNGVWVDLMKPVVANMSAEDFVNVSAYIASLQP